MTETLADEQATLAFASQLATRLRPGNLVFLHGDLGAGKTTLVRGILRAFGYAGSVKSPTYTLLEPYETTFGSVLHFDFYRIGDPQELEFIGIDELMDSAAVKFVEWPERASGRMPNPDLDVYLEEAGTGRTVSLSWHVFDD